MTLTGYNRQGRAGVLQELKSNDSWGLFPRYFPRRLYAVRRLCLPFFGIANEKPLKRLGSSAGNRRSYIKRNINIQSAFWLGWNGQSLRDGDNRNRNRPGRLLTTYLIYAIKHALRVFKSRRGRLALLCLLRGLTTRTRYQNNIRRTLSLQYRTDQLIQTKSSRGSANPLTGSIRGH